MQLKQYKQFYAGTSNVVLPVPNKAHFPEAYQDKSRLSYYASLFNSVEVNSTFYKLPQPSTIARWASEVPGDFRFTFKFPKDISHARGLEYDRAKILQFMQAIEPAIKNRGCLLLQFPASLTSVFFGRFKHLLNDINAAQSSASWRLAVEFRHRSWYHSKVYALLEQYKTTIVTHDMPSSSTPITDIPTDFEYLRFHGENGKYGGSYDDFFLAEYAGYIRQWLVDGKAVFVYFNNTMGAAVKNLVALNSM